MLIGKNITKLYNGKEVLKRIDIAVEPGKITSIIGPSGAGKTTLLKVLSMLEEPESGTVTLEGEAFRSPWPRVSVVFQQLFIWPHLTLRKNIELPILVKDQLEENKVYLEELYAMFDMREFIDRFPNEVSLGQRQRAALVRALALKPTYLLLDEITSSLDVEQSEIILSHLSAIKQKGVGIIMVAHNIDFAISSADTVCFMEDGKIIKQGKPYEFLLETKNKRISDFIDKANMGMSEVRIYSGKEEFQAYHLSLLERLPEGSTITIIGGLGSTWYEPMSDAYMHYNQLRIKKNIVWDMLMYEYGEEDQRLVREYPHINNFSILSSSMKNMADININSDGTVLLQIFEGVPMVIEIKNQALADSYMRYYHDLVKHSNKFS